MFKTATTAALAAILFSYAAASAGPTPEQKCEGGMNQEAGKYAACIAKAEKGLVSTLDGDKYMAALDKCHDKLVGKWDKLEAGAVAKGTACPSVGDQGAIEDFQDACGQSVAAALAGGALGPDPVACSADLATCDGDLVACESDVAACEAEPEAQPLKTGQVTCYDAGGGVTPCAGSGQDGESQLGVDHAFVDNGDGTITDNATGLMWEKLSNDGTIHDKDNTYTWSNAFAVKVATLNTDEFAGFNDWRVPNLHEMETLRNIGAVGPATYSDFNTSCPASCTVLTCSCILNGNHWTSDTFAPTPTTGWYVGGNSGVADNQIKTATSSVRGVRGGS